MSLHHPETSTNDPLAKDAGGRPRRHYEKPTLLVIPLVADEVLAVGCKLDNGGSGPVGISCTSAHCSAPGS
ncbi:MAG: hypothetical protein DRJ61_09390 [Acidobacteria bacterium]|nr:MAG: hypothetical protein DRJ61_09390 [Acidobacteriota bacterium]